MGKDMTYFLFIGMFQGIVNQTKVFRKEEEATKAFFEYTNYEWDKITKDDQVYEDFDCSDYSGSQILETHIEP